MLINSPASQRTRLLNRLAMQWSAARLHYVKELQAKIGCMFDRFMDERLADPTFGKQVTDGLNYVHEQRMAELLLADELWALGFSLSSNREGPDFLATKAGQSVWVELTTPEPSGIDPAWLTPSPIGVWSYPHTEIALRYTAAIKEKHQKLVGASGSGGKPGYLENGIVGPQDSYVIAINQHLLQSSFRTLTGISQIPTACEILFAVGPQQLHINRSTGMIVGQDHIHRPSIPKTQEIQVPADSFLNPAYSPVSAVLALDLVLEKLITPDPDHLLMREHLSAMVYNPSATNPVPSKWIGAQTHWVARETNGAIEIRSE